MSTTPRKTPCASCPFRRSVPSGIWHASEYAKLPAYDGDISEQSSARTFLCHQSAQEACAGWLGHRDPTELLAVRLGLSSGSLDPSCADYTTDVELFGSGQEAAEHGMREIQNPQGAARTAIDKITQVRSHTDHPIDNT